MNPGASSGPPLARQYPWPTALGWLSAGLAVAFLAASCATVSRSVVVPFDNGGAAFVGNKACAECHTNICRIFPASAHARVFAPGLPLKDLSGCESCHGPGSKHVQGGGGRGKFIVNPGKAPEACYRCHLELQAEFSLPQHHPVPEGHLNCVQCHDPHGGDIKKPAGGLAMARLNQTCAPCHRQESGPKVYAHEALREGCTVCHRPHGSVNPKMLVQRDANLCLRCHVQVQLPDSGGPGGELFIGKSAHAAYLRQGTCWSAGCHTAVHGSNINRLLRY